MAKRRRERGPAFVGRLVSTAMLALTGVAPYPHETVQQFSTRARRQVDADTAGDLSELALLTTTARYGPAAPDDESCARADGLADDIRERVIPNVGAWRRLGWELDPRPLFRRRSRLAQDEAAGADRVPSG